RTSNGVWLRIAKRDSGRPSVTYPEALETALCFGWIDGQKRPGDTRTWLQKFTPRRPRSIWSRINRTKIAALTRQGRMRAAGRAAVERAKQGGQWSAAYHSQSRAVIPPDFRAALDGAPAAKAFFATVTSANRYAVLYRIQTAKRPETRARRIREFIAMLRRKETLHG
ncbi:MAG TPA: YdeI/OmpD-associated family protein, partial [Gemmatimonadales bacterium]|nr:YdeI/OmpD-associated family protein [Gemmatimonadales bacterium]